jgi:leucyl aminopeptidase
MTSFTRFAGRFVITALSTVALNAHAHTNTSEHIIVAPVCLLKNATFTYKTISSTPTLALISTDHQNIDQLIDIKNTMHTPCGGFMDVTHSWTKTAGDSKQQAARFLASHEKIAATPSFANEPLYEIKYPSQVNQLLSQLNPEDMWADLTILSNFKDRYANSADGVKAAEWIKTQIETMAKNTGHTDVTAYYVQTGKNYKQPSLVVKFGNSNEAGVVIGAHMDTLQSSWEKKPGADDDGSGSVTVMEALRVLLSSGMHFKKPVYFVWYAAEEEGLVGSQQVVADFKAKKIPINAVLHFDMTGYAYKNEPTMWVMDDYTNKSLTNYVISLITTYVKKPVKHSQCGYSCSDHASWTLEGYAATIPAEAAYENTNPSMHSSQDTMDKLSLVHMTDYAKLAIATAAELAEPVSK